MALSAQDRRTLEAMAAQFAADDPGLVRSLSEHGGSAMVTAERISSRWDAWPVALMAVCLAAFALTLVITGTPPTP